MGTLIKLDKIDPHFLGKPKEGQRQIKIKDNRQFAETMAQVDREFNIAEDIADIKRFCRESRNASKGCKRCKYRGAMGDPISCKLRGAPFAWEV